MTDQNGLSFYGIDTLGLCPYPSAPHSAHSTGHIFKFNACNSSVRKLRLKKMKMRAADIRENQECNVTSPGIINISITEYEGVRQENKPSQTLALLRIHTGSATCTRSTFHILGSTVLKRPLHVTIPQLRHVMLVFGNPGHSQPTRTLEIGF